MQAQPAVVPWHSATKLLLRGATPALPEMLCRRRACLVAQARQGAASMQDIASAAAVVRRRGDTSPSGLELGLGVVIGINPTVGVTTALVLMFAWAFGL